MANPKLAMIPTGYKAGKVYSVLPESGVGDFTFDRDSKATRVNENGLIETMDNDVPRLDYTDGGCPSLLLEPERTNLIQYSEDFSQSYWTKNNVNLTSGFISPDGTANAFKLTSDLTNNVHRIRLSSLASGIATSSQFTYSFFLKKAELKWFLLKAVINGQSLTVDVWFDLENGVIGTESNGSGKIEDYGNDWYRCSINIVTNSSASSINIYGYLADKNGIPEAYQGDGTSGVYIYGAQLEESEYPTSYIPTNGSTVTRVGETCNDAGDASTFNDSEGVLMAEISALDNSTVGQLSISDASTDNRVYFTKTGTLNQLRFSVVDGGSTQASITATLNDNTCMNKVASKYKTNDCAFWINGFKIGTETSSTMPSGLNELAFDSGSGSLDFYGNTKQIQYFDTVLTDAELETLTSWQSFLEMANGQNYTII